MKIKDRKTKMKQQRRNDRSKRETQQKNNKHRKLKDAKGIKIEAKNHF